VKISARIAPWLLAATVALPPGLLAQEPLEPASPEACKALEADAERLACYDLAFGRQPSAEAPPVVLPTPSGGFVVPRPPEEPAPRSLLDSRWELFPESKLGTFGMRAYQPVYVLPYLYSNSPNETPSSPAPGHSVEDGVLDQQEVKFQISFKTKVWQGIFGEQGDLWFGYTQSSRWQLYDTELSRPFRETNYEPELMLVFGIDQPILGWHARLLSVGLNHQSNGRDVPRSRSWNRVTASVGFERPGWTLTFRPWWRIKEEADDDDNPDIEDHVGRGEVLLVRHWRHHEFAALFRHTLRDGDRMRGAAQLDWAFPIRGNLRGHVQIFRGYGESLIDYNHLSTQIGVGISLIEWY
jgi:phospholipase A1